MSGLDFALGLAGVPDETVAELKKQLPALTRLGDAAKQAEPIITKMLPLIAQLQPIVQKAYPDVVAVTPLINELIAFVKAKET